MKTLEITIVANFDDDVSNSEIENILINELPMDEYENINIKEK